MNPLDFLQTTHRSVNWFAKTLDDEELQMQPPFQRNPVWTVDQQSYLIDTILNGFPIPELYMQTSVQDDGQEIHIVVDGQQRITACLQFLEGGFALEGEKVAAAWNGLEFDELSPDQQRRFRTYQFVVRLLPEMAQEQLSLIFQRLNRNVVALNAQELRHSTYWGDFIQTVEGLAGSEAWNEFGVFTLNDVRRMLDIEFISELVIAYIYGPQNKKVNLDRYYQINEHEFEERPMVEETFNVVLAELDAIFADQPLRRTRWRKKSDFYSLFLVFADHFEDLPLSRDGRALAEQLLTDLGSDVTEYLKKNRDPEIEFHPDVIAYAEAVRRAASDRSNRVTRGFLIENELEEVWSA